MTSFREDVQKPQFLTLNPPLSPDQDFSQKRHLTQVMYRIAFYHHIDKYKLLITGFGENVQKPQFLTLNPPD